MLEALIAQLETIEDPRCAWKVEHRLLDILVIAVCAVLGEAESFEDIALYGRCKRDWLGTFLALPNGIPSHDTFRRVLMLVDPDAFERLLPRLGAGRVPAGGGRAAPGRGRRQDGAALVRPPQGALAPAPGQRLRDRARAGARPSARPTASRAS